MVRVCLNNYGGRKAYGYAKFSFFDRGLYLISVSYNTRVAGDRLGGKIIVIDHLLVNPPFR